MKNADEEIIQVSNSIALFCPEEDALELIHDPNSFELERKTAMTLKRIRERVINRLLWHKSRQEISEED
jgi:hypothetical protein